MNAATTDTAALMVLMRAWSPAEQRIPAENLSQFVELTGHYARSAREYGSAGDSLAMVVRARIPAGEGP